MKKKRSKTKLGWMIRLAKLSLSEANQFVIDSNKKSLMPSSVMMLLR